MFCCRVNEWKFMKEILWKCITSVCLWAQNEDEGKAEQAGEQEWGHRGELQVVWCKSGLCRHILYYFILCFELLSTLFQLKLS